MANTKYAYVRNFELPDPLLPNTFLVFRVDGHSFHRFSDAHNFTKPNDIRALQLMDHAARDTMEAHPDIVLAFGESDEYSFLLKKSTTIYSRRQSKILSTLTSQFTSSYVYHWSGYFPDKPLQYPPSFDGRIVLYPTEKEVKDYFAWRQADTHINNLYNTTFWALVQEGNQTTTEAHATLRGTFSKDKNEILFSRFNINYSTIDARFRKGSVLVREALDEYVVPQYQESQELEERGLKRSQASHPLSEVFTLHPLAEETESTNETILGRLGDTPSTFSAVTSAATASDSTGDGRRSYPRVSSEISTPPIVLPAGAPQLLSGALGSSTNIDARADANDLIINVSTNLDPAELKTITDSVSSTTIPPSLSSANSAQQPRSNPQLPLNPAPKTQPTVKPNQRSKPKSKSKQKPTRIELLHCDIIHDEFWTARSDLLSD
ncbi:Thg1-domain-containing protein [Macrolepiota fuliginosa MF-IS2]|uniref:tRNA(His) guanylyltransferase n=1 Tax=Macrolepiota fuliginosa MF-IS2 TaxID=1400762 RepID=A0A9P5XHR0_9AGAR|nr:Thg1-domain-containing protein [Macrolepiota fuliginosa MF-IS2]